MKGPKRHQLHSKCKEVHSLPALEALAMWPRKGYSDLDLQEASYPEVVLNS